MARQRGGVLSTSQHALVVSINLFTALLCAYIVLGHLLEENWLLNIVKKKQFFRNFMAIILFGVVGTMISFFTISLDMVVLDGQTWWSASEKQHLRKKRLSSMWLLRAEQYVMVDQNSFLTN
ncbi:hypothetical protein QYE76_012421 [Lolium multiflorum]|uniref:Uncharacterized protein n=1 Tax=Lolium multiflorum TaxID=4521 RepID=A0AAD8U0Y7_LOLMU|nr:hypothetical protein QYE76_012421 [Lolium multiflorum]